MDTPARDLRLNLATWAVPKDRGPAVAARMLELLPRESFDPGFSGQCLTTTYFDTANFDLRKARLKGDKYLTVRIRCYERDDTDDEAYALSWKTETAKQRSDLSSIQADYLKDHPSIVAFTPYIRADAMARLYELIEDAPLIPAVHIHCRRYAVEDNEDRLTLDCAVYTNRDICLKFGVLEFKSVDATHQPPASLTALHLPPLKISKFLWATSPMHGSN